MIPNEALEAAKEAMSEVTPQPGVSKTDWLVEHGRFAWLAGALEAAAPYIKAQAIDKAVEDAEALGLAEIPVHALRFRADCYRNIGTNLYGGKE